MAAHDDLSNFICDLYIAEIPGAICYAADNVQSIFNRVIQPAAEKNPISGSCVQSEQAGFSSTIVVGVER